MFVSHTSRLRRCHLPVSCWVFRPPEMSHTFVTPTFFPTKSLCPRELQRRTGKERWWWRFSRSPEQAFGSPCSGNSWSLFSPYQKIGYRDYNISVKDVLLVFRWYLSLYHREGNDLNQSLGGKWCERRRRKGEYEEHGGDADAEQAVQHRATNHLLLCCNTILKLLIIHVNVQGGFLTIFLLVSQSMSQSDILSFWHLFVG